MKKFNIQQKIFDFLKSEITCAVFFLLMGLALILAPVQTVDVICKAVFGLLLILTGLYTIWMYVSDRVQTTVLNMFAGVILLILGWFMFENPQIVIKLFPRLLGALVIVDSVWMVKTAINLKKKGVEKWNLFLIGGLACVILGLLVMLNPFSKVRQTIIFGGAIFLLNGAADIVFYILARQQKPGEIIDQKPDIDYPGPKPGIIPHGMGHFGAQGQTYYENDMEPDETGYAAAGQPQSPVYQEPQNPVYQEPQSPAHHEPQEASDPLVAPWETSGDFSAQADPADDSAKE